MAEAPDLMEALLRSFDRCAREGCGKVRAAHDKRNGECPALLGGFVEPEPRD